jgi:CRISPR/Cas system CSM-associated protein Csm5 (group 7 of RAMP superfamily)
LIGKLKECLKRSKEIVDSFDELEKDVQTYNENLQIRLQLQKQRMGLGSGWRFSKIMSLFEKNAENRPS